MRLDVFVAHSLRGNPGLSGAGVLLVKPDGSRVVRSRWLGRSTEGVAQWCSLLLAAQVATEMGGTDVSIRVTSETLAAQLLGKDGISRGVSSYRVNTLALLGAFERWEVECCEANESAEAAARSIVEAHAPMKAKAAAPTAAGTPKVPCSVSMALFPDEVSVPFFAPSTEEIRRFVQEEEARLTAADFVRLRSGRDAFSSLRLEELRARVPGLVAEDVQKALWRDDDQEKALRWVLRGLPVGWAIRKIRSDVEAGQNANRGRRFKPVAGH